MNQTNPLGSITLSVAFDIGQISGQLVWSFIDSNGKPVQHTDGRNSGLFSLTYGQSFNVAVTATSVAAGTTVAMVDCQLVTFPLMFSKGNVAGGAAGTFPYPSPFFTPGAPTGTCTDFYSNNPFTAPSHTPNTLAWTSAVAPTVTSAGRWNMKFAMTVAITSGGVTQWRVFGFDPEGESSSGVVPTT